jgi:putative tryptophan/tyrosine transport system substrate-binding protein
VQDRRRRLVIGGAAFLPAIAWSSLGPAQGGKKLPTLGLLYPNPSSPAHGNWRDFFWPRLNELGWFEGRNLTVENASAEGREERLPALAAALVAKKVDVIWAAGPEAALSAARATRTIPIAFYGVADPVAQGFVDSLARPGRNITGLASLAGSERAKSVELLREIAPTPRRLGWIRVETVFPVLNGGQVSVRTSDLDSASDKLGFEIQGHVVSKREHFDTAFARILQTRAEAVGSDFTALTFRERQPIVDFVNRHRLPSVFGATPFVEAGGLLSYGAHRIGMQLQSFTYVDRILRGARPAELPVELPTRFELAVNIRTAKALGLTIPSSVLIRADRVIE